MSGCGHGGPRSHGLGRGRPQQPLARIRELVVLGKLGQRGGGRRMTLLHLANSLARDCKLWTMIADSEPILWSDTLHMLLSCASSAASASRSAVLEEALRALANICTHADKHAMWEDELMMKALLLAGSRRRGGDAHWKVREQAFRALCCLSAEAANQEPMWGHATGITSDVSWEFRRVLLDGVGDYGSAGEVRTMSPGLKALGLLMAVIAGFLFGNTWAPPPHAPPPHAPPPHAPPPHATRDTRPAPHATRDTRPARWPHLDPIFMRGRFGAAPGHSRAQHGTTRHDMPRHDTICHRY